MNELDWATVLVAGMTIAIALHLFAIGTLGTTMSGHGLSARASHVLGGARRIFDRWVARRLAHRAAQASGRRVVGLPAVRRR